MFPPMNEAVRAKQIGGRGAYGFSHKAAHPCIMNKEDHIALFIILFPQKWY